MGDRLPPLRSIEAFVAVGRHMSFSRAADELSITQPAVTRRIQRLEEDLGFNLLQRSGNKLALTAAGENYLDVVGPAFDALHDGTRVLRTQRENARVRIRIAQSLAWAWLAPRLGAFHAAHPNIDLQIETAMSDGDFAVEDVDLMISFGRPQNWKGLKCEALVVTRFFPVAAPDSVLAETGSEEPASVTLDALSRTPLIALKQFPWAWGQWFSRLGRPELAPQPVYSFDNLQLAFQAAAHGLGVTLGTDILCAPYFYQGTLARLPTESASLDAAFHMVGRVEEWDARPIRTVRHWLARSISPYLRDHAAPWRDEAIAKTA